jgi:F-type H+-transporting ATPase subunit delta
MMPTTVLQTKRGAKALYRWCLVDGWLDESRARQVVKHLLQFQRHGYLAMLSEFKRLVKFEYDSRTARVESAAPLQSDLQASIRKNLEIVYGKGITTEFAQNPELIGGMRVRVASDVYDGSVKSRLAALATSFGVPTG